MLQYQPRRGLTILKEFWTVQFDILLLANKIFPPPNWNSTHDLSQVLRHVVLDDSPHINSSNVYSDKLSQVCGLLCLFNSLKNGAACEPEVDHYGRHMEICSMGEWKVHYNKWNGAPNQIRQNVITKNVRFKIRSWIPAALLFLSLLFSYFRGNFFLPCFFYFYYKNFNYSWHKVLY